MRERGGEMVASFAKIDITGHLHASKKKRSKGGALMRCRSIMVLQVMKRSRHGNVVGFGVKDGEGK
jgi:hypothetical protein